MFYLKRCFIIKQYNFNLFFVLLKYYDFDKKDFLKNKNMIKLSRLN